MSNFFADRTFALFDNALNKKLRAEIEKTGAKILKFPSIEAEKISLSAASFEIIRNLHALDWVIFADVLAVDFFLEILEENRVDFFELDDVRVCAAGEAVSDRLRFAQLHADVIPHRVDVENVLSSLQSYIAADRLTELKFLVVKEIALDNEIERELLKAGATVSEMPIYRIEFGAKEEITKLKTLFKGGAIDEFIFSAPTDFAALKYIFGEEPFAELFSEIKVSGVDALTLQTVREHGLQSADLFRMRKIDTV